jgi:hypothetical protein
MRKNLINIDDPKNYRLTGKKQFEVHVCMPPVGTRITNFLEKATDVTCEKRRFVMTGTLGELWVITADRLASTYTYNGRPIDVDLIRSKAYGLDYHPCAPRGHQVMDWIRVQAVSGGMTNAACFVPLRQKGKIATAWGAILNFNAPYNESMRKKGISHGTGDFIVCTLVNGFPNLADRWVVNGVVFSHTYRLDNFKGVTSEVLREAGGNLITDLPKLW